MAETLSKDQMELLFEQQKMMVTESFREQLKNDVFLEMVIKIWSALFIDSNPVNGKENTKLFLASFSDSVTDNFMQNVDEMYKIYSNNSDIIISKSDYTKSFEIAMYEVLKSMSDFFDLDKKIISTIPS